MSKSTRRVRSCVIQALDFPPSADVIPHIRGSADSTPFRSKRGTGRRFSDRERRSAGTRSYSAAQLEPTSRTSRQPGRLCDYLRTESRRSPEGRERNGIANSPSKLWMRGRTTAVSTRVSAAKRATRTERAGEAASESVSGSPRGKAPRINIGCGGPQPTLPTELYVVAA